MKKILLQSFGWLAVILFAVNHNAFSQANTSLSNLVSPTSVNQSLLPSSDNSKSLGSSALSWKDGYFDGTGYFLTGLNVGGSSSINGIQLNPNSTGKTIDLRFLELSANGTNYVGFKAPASIAANKVWVLPSADGSSGQVLSTDGAGTLSWITPASGGAITNNFIPRSNGSGLVDGSLYDNGDEIGLGTSSPGAFLHINKAADLDNPHILINQVGADEYARIYLKSYTNEIGDERKWKVLARTSTTDANNNFYIQQTRSLGGGSWSTSTRFYIDYDGKIGLGTSVPAAKLHVNTDYFGDEFIVGPEIGTPHFIVDALGMVGINTADPNSYLHVNAPSGEDPLRVQVNGQSKLYVNSNGGTSIGSSTTPPLNGLYVAGNTGMGTSSPQVRLHLSGTDEVLRLDGTNPYMQFFSASAAKAYIQSTGNDFRLGTVGTNTSGKVQITAGSSTAMTINSSGNVGIGTTSPAGKLHLKGNNEVLRIEGTDAFIQFYSGTTAKAFIWRTGNDFKLGTSTGNSTGRMILGTAGGGDQLWLLADGRVSIGTSAAATGYKLSVDGKVMCEELRVEMSPWADYVFHEDYKLRPLTEVESFIQANKHLPGVPSAAEIESAGLDVGQMQATMMEKIEELTLYVIDLQKQNDELRMKVSQIGKQ
ncbi:MAG: hypothetical protein K1X63_15815 [Chitinophagales bacterium]|nr:hypothetical protein [Chitinophagales bacterium]